MSGMPKITIVTPSYNQAAYLERTIRSVLDQDYKNLEYIVIDGGSTDASVDIIKKYGSRLAYWHSRKDAGQADAIRTGFQMATGEIMAWLNSDDVYEPGILKEVADVFSKNEKTDVVYGNMRVIDGQDKIVSERRLVGYLPILSKMGMIYGGYGIYQPAAFWRSELYRKVGGLNPKYIHCMDNDLFIKFAANNAGFKFMRKDLASFRVHADSKTTNLRSVAEREISEIVEEYSVKNGTLSAFYSICSKTALKVIKPFIYILQGDSFWLAERLVGKTILKDLVP